MSPTFLERNPSLSQPHLFDINYKFIFLALLSTFFRTKLWTLDLKFASMHVYDSFFFRTAIVPGRHLHQFINPFHSTCCKNCCVTVVIVCLKMFNRFHINQLDTGLDANRKITKVTLLISCSSYKTFLYISYKILYYNFKT